VGYRGAQGVPANEMVDPGLVKTRRIQDEQNGVDDRNESVRKVLANLTFGERYLLQPYR
jgi:hypothetical protein